jgi:hypothetical protein
MSKGPKPPPDSPPIRPEDPDIVVDPVLEKCWTFQLVETTAAAKRVERDTQVTGSVHRRKRLLVSARGEALGFAPSTESEEIIAVVEKSGGTLRGRILSTEEDAAGVLVELCLRS